MREILGEKQWMELCADFYGSCYMALFNKIGHPIGDVCEKGTHYRDMKAGDVILLEEEGRYSRIYQSVPNERGFLIIEQYLDVSNPDEDVWKNVIPSNPNIVFKPKKTEFPVQPIYQLQENEKQLWEMLSQFMKSHNRELYEYILQALPTDKIQAIERIIDLNGLYLSDMWNENYRMFDADFSSWQQGLYEV